MHIQISLNPKHESDRVTAFVTQLDCYGHDIAIVLDNADLIDQEKPASLENVKLPRHLLGCVNRVIHVVDGGNDTVTILYERAGK